MSDSIVIRGGWVLDPANRVDARLDVLVADGIVARLAPDIEAAGAEVLDASGCLVVPGFIDLHAHLREPGFEQKGTIATETLAALRGGFTTVCAMPNTRPAPDSGPVVESLWERIRRDAHVRVYPIGCVTRGRAGKELAELSELAAAGCVAFSDDGDPVASATLMRSALELAGDLGLPLSEHSDDPEINAGGCMNEGRMSERLGLAGQPIAAEAAAISRNIALAEASAGHIHIAHITTARGVELVADAKARGIRVTCEVTPSHLFLTEDAVFGAGPEPAYDTNARVNPPLRTEADRKALIRGLEEGIIDAIATDHAPHAIEDKACEFDQAAPGISCIETAVPSTWELIARGELTRERVVAALTTGPVRAFGLDRRLQGIGTLTPGQARDITVIAPTVSGTVDTDTFASKGKNTPLKGMVLRGRVAAVIYDGQIAFRGLRS